MWIGLSCEFEKPNHNTTLTKRKTPSKNDHFRDLGESALLTVNIGQVQNRRLEHAALELIQLGNPTKRYDVGRGGGAGHSNWRACSSTCGAHLFAARKKQKSSQLAHTCHIFNIRVER